MVKFLLLPLPPMLLLLLLRELMLLQVPLLVRYIPNPRETSGLGRPMGQPPGSDIAVN